MPVEIEVLAYKAYEQKYGGRKQLRMQQICTEWNKSYDVISFQINHLCMSCHTSDLSTTSLQVCDLLPKPN